MSDEPATFRWARRVRQDVIERLYRLDAKGIVDEELIDEAGYAMYARCDSIRIATRAHYGRAACHGCGAMLEHGWKRDEPLECACGWTTTWGAYLKSYQGKQLFGGNAYSAFREFHERWPKARAPLDKLLAIDRLIHACHIAGVGTWTRPAATNLIEGTASEIALFLDALAYGSRSTPELAETRREWQRRRAVQHFPDELRR